MQMTQAAGTKHITQLQAHEALFRELCSKNLAKALRRMFYLNSQRFIKFYILYLECVLPKLGHKFLNLPYFRQDDQSL